MSGISGYSPAGDPVRVHGDPASKPPSTVDSLPVAPYLRPVPFLPRVEPACLTASFICDSLGARLILVGDDDPGAFGSECARDCRTGARPAPVASERLFSGRFMIRFPLRAYGAVWRRAPRTGIKVQPVNPYW